MKEQLDWLTKSLADRLGINQKKYLTDSFKRTVVEYCRENDVNPDSLYAIFHNDIRDKRDGRFKCIKEPYQIFVSDFYPISLDEYSKKQCISWLYYSLDITDDRKLAKYIVEKNNLNVTVQNVYEKIHFMRVYTVNRTYTNEAILNGLISLYNNRKKRDCN